MTWTTPDGQRAVKILADAGLLEWQLAAQDEARYPNDTARRFLVDGQIHLEHWCPKGHRVSLGSVDTHVEACILRDAARRYLPDVEYAEVVDDVWRGHGYDAALIAAVLAVEGGAK